MPGARLCDPGLRTVVERISETRKGALAEMRTHIKQLQNRTNYLLEKKRRQQEQLVRTARYRVAELVDVQTVEVLEIIIRACSDAMFDDKRDKARRKVLDDLPRKYNYITSVLSWNPTTSKNVEIKEKALALISADQMELASTLNLALKLSRQALKAFNLRSTRNRAQHPRTNKAAALNLVKYARERLNFSSQTISQIEDLLKDCPRPLPNAEFTCFFLDDELTPCPDTWQEALDDLTDAEEELRDLEQVIAKGREEESRSILSKHY
ncbi:hypothetical protein GGX14DRAFT_576199 [Mycena pura]|uniref:Uncharacterized protein n=1 Tax=Mycena pura TaxID=153505 RepID=A0AAD6UU71_9AGAR|nr:hypothetical protein GGX14DRAFT_576199 [Mycena pura]